MRLEAKLALLGIGTALLAVVLVAVVSRRSTVMLVEHRIADNDRRTAAVAFADVARWRSVNGSWHGAGGRLAAASTASGHDLMLFDAARRCVASAPASLCAEQVQFETGDRLTIRNTHPGAMSERRFVGAPFATLPGERAGTAGWTLLALPQLPVGAVAPSGFFASQNTSLWFGGAIAALVATLVSLLLARTLVRPVRRLIAVAESMGAGDLAQRVEVDGTSEMVQLGVAFNTMAEGLSRQERLRRDMLHDVAHELRAPLTNMRCRLESVQDGLARMEPATLASLHDDVMLLSRLVDDLRDIALADAGQLQLTLGACKVDDVVRRVADAMAPSARERDVALVVDADPATARADGDRVAQIVTNLLSNAVRHATRGGAVRVRVREDGDCVALEVKDDGPGIRPQHLDLVFERFFRTDASRARESGGAGLGLAIVKQLVELQGGTVAVTSALGSGACFAVHLPRSDRDTQPALAAAARDTESIGVKSS